MLHIEHQGHSGGCWVYHYSDWKKVSINQQTGTCLILAYFNVHTESDKVKYLLEWAENGIASLDADKTCQTTKAGLLQFEWFHWSESHSLVLKWGVVFDEGKHSEIWAAPQWYENSWCSINGEISGISESDVTCTYNMSQNLHPECDQICEWLSNATI